MLCIAPICNRRAFNNPAESDYDAGGSRHGVLPAAVVSSFAALPRPPIVLIYEYPLTERIRALLRLEALFARMGHYLGAPGTHDHHAALTALFEILEVARPDLKSELLQELERQRQALIGFRDNPNISATALDVALDEISQALTQLHAVSGKLGQHLRDNEWLISIKGRSQIPGGLSEFDIPSYHLWLNQPAGQRQRELQGWLEPFLPLRDGLTIVLHLLRDSGTPEPCTAQRGSYQRGLGGINAQMLRIRIHDPMITPETSANKYALNVRFMQTDFQHRPHQVEGDVRFDLTFCAI